MTSTVQDIERRKGGNQLNSAALLELKKMAENFTRFEEKN